MTEECFKTKKKNLEEKLKKDLFELYKEFCFSNNPYGIGDKVMDKWGGVLVLDKMGISMRYSGIPECVYYGPRLTKKGEPYKSGERLSILQSSLKEVCK